MCRPTFNIFIIQELSSICLWCDFSEMNRKPAKCIEIWLFLLNDGKPYWYKFTQSGQKHWTHKHSVQVSATRGLQKFFLTFFPLARARHASDHTEHNRSSSPFHDSSLKEQNALKDRKFWLFFPLFHRNYSATSGNFLYPTSSVL